MTTSKMSVTRALVEIKNSESRINAAITNGTFVGTIVGAAKKVSGSQETAEEFSKRIQGSYDKLDALLRNRDAFKSAVVLSNANTRVRIAGIEMTVAEAIERKASITFRKSTLMALRNAYSRSLLDIRQSDATLDQKVTAMLTTVLGSDKSKHSSEVATQITDKQHQDYKMSLLDPCDIQKRIDALDEEIRAFETEVDFALSESNARTEITVELA